MFKGYYRLLLIIMVASHFQGCHSRNNNHRSLTYFTGCQNFEIQYDLSLSIENNLSLLDELNVSLIHDSTRIECGYKFQFGEESRIINSVMTDVDLMLELKGFFKK